MQWNRAPCCRFVGKSMETETKTWSELHNGEKAIDQQILASEEKHKSKRAGLWESQSGILVGKLTTWVRSSFSSTRIKSPKIKTLADGLIERTSLC